MPRDYDTDTAIAESYGWYPGHQFDRPAGTKPHYGHWQDERHGGDIRTLCGRTIHKYGSFRLKEEPTENKACKVCWRIRQRELVETRRVAT
ncbi:hypothetical protein ES703_120759 [subsurface metagenome]